MKMARRILGSCGFVFMVLGLVWACGFDDTLREYLDVHFWLPFSKKPRHFERSDVRRISAPFAGMADAKGEAPLAKLRAAYQQISQPESVSFDVAALRQAVAAARADTSLTRREREEVDLIDAKIDMRSGQPGEPQLLQSAKKKFEAFLRTAQTPEFLSEARGWLARMHYLLGDQTAAGKMYLDELNRNGSNLGRETLLNSLQLTYGYDGGRELLAHLEEYFDTPEHAAFAIQMVTNPRWDREYGRYERKDTRVANVSQPYIRIKGLLEKHIDLFRSNAGANTLALLGMRTALGMGDPPGAVKLAQAVPAGAAIRTDPDFQWMLASAHFLSREYAAAERPLLSLFRSPRSSENQRAAAAYGLCGVYQKSKNVAEQLRFALWLHTAVRKNKMYLTHPSGIGDMSVYWAVSGWDLNMLLDAEAPIEALESFVNRNPNLADIRLVKYSLAVRLTRENRYEEAARIYQSINAIRRAPRMRQLAALYQEANRTDLADRQRQEAKYRLAEFISANSTRIYFNDALWRGFQGYALVASSDSRLTRAERQAMIDGERKLKDDQEERWRAYLILRDVVRDAGKTDLGRQAAALAVRCLRGISDRFERQAEIRKADIELSRWLRQ
jgi:tetratricopeptide (TPR) repeat protein